MVCWRVNCMCWRTGLTLRTPKSAAFAACRRTWRTKPSPNRDGAAALDKWYFTAVKSTSLRWQTRPEVYLPKWQGRGRHPMRLKLGHPAVRPVPVKDLAADLPRNAWLRATIKDGSQGPLVGDFAFLRVVEAHNGLPGPTLWLALRRNLADPAVIKFY